MNNQERIQELEKLKQNYLILREILLSYKKQLEVTENEKEEVYVKKLVLTKPFYGKNLQVG